MRPESDQIAFCHVVILPIVIDAFFVLSFGSPVSIVVAFL